MAGVVAARKIFAGLQAGRVERDLFTSDALAYFTPAVVKDFQASLGPMGAPVAFDAAGSGERGGMTFRVYRVRTQTRTISISTFARAFRQIRPVPDFASRRMSLRYPIGFVPTSFPLKRSH